MRTRSDSPTKNCTIDGCGRALRARGLCSTHYNQTHQPARHAARLVDCAACGTPIMRPFTSRQRPACSVQCRTQLQCGRPSTGLGGYDWAADAAHRAREAGAPLVIQFNRDDIFERDGWTCYLCGKTVDRDVSPFHPDSPTVDHVIPLSRGGEHSTRNAATAHLHCNSAKQDRMIDSTILPNRT